MATFHVSFRGGGGLDLEAEHLHPILKEGSDIHSIWVKAANGEILAVLPSDVIKAVYRMDIAQETAEK